MKRQLMCLLFAAGLLTGSIAARADQGAPFVFAPREPTVQPAETPAAVTNDPPAATPAPASDAERQARVVRFFQGARVRCGVLVVTKDGQDVLRVAYGTRDHADHPATFGTRFRVASVTKLVSAIGLMTLYDEGRFSLDEPLSDILGYPVANPCFPDVPVTPRQTLSHTSSITSDQLHPHWETLPKVNPYFKQDTLPGTEFHYANLNGGLTGAMIEALSGVSVNTFMAGRVFRPLNIDAAYHAGLLEEKTDLSEIMNKNGSIRSAVRWQINTVVDYDDSCDPRGHTNKTVGSLYISADGLTRIAQMLLNRGEIDGIRILQEDTVRLMEQDQQMLPGSSVKCESPYGLSLIRINDIGEHTWYGHQGRYLGLVANIYYQPDTGLTIALIANAYSGTSTNHVANLSRRIMNYVDEQFNEPRIQ